MSTEAASTSSTGSSQESTRGAAAPVHTSSHALNQHALDQRDERREKRGKNTLLWRELALIVALAVVILAFRFDWGNPESDRDVAARPHETVYLQDVRMAPPPPEEPEPQPERRQQAPPEREVPKNIERTEVPDEQVEEAPTPAENPVQEIEVSAPATARASNAPATRPQAMPAPSPPPASKVFSEGTAERNAQMQGGPLRPDYPRRALNAGIQGQVILQFVVDESGRAQAIEVLRSPSDLLSEAAVEALRKKRFTPAQQSGQPVKMRMSQPVTFRLQ